jgi:hypothetical protein
LVGSTAQCYGGTDATCDPPRNCVMGSSTCPTNNAAAAGTTCRPSVGTCDVAETCGGNVKSCPADSFAANNVMCAMSSSVCQANTYCTGSSPMCPSATGAQSSVACAFPSGGDKCHGTAYCPGAASQTCPALPNLSNSVMCYTATAQCKYSRAVRAFVAD